MFDLLFNERVARQDLFNYFGYIENWRILPFYDSIGVYWSVDEENKTVRYAQTELELETQDGRYWETEIYTNRYLRKWVYRGKDYTMILTDPHCDMNQFLQIFSNEKERPYVQ